MGKRPHRPAELVGRIFLGSAVVRQGLLTPDQLRSSAWRRLFLDVYADVELAMSHLLTCRGAGLVLPSYAAVTGRSAACLAGLPLGEPDEPVHVLIPSGRKFQMRGMSVRRARLPPAHVRPGHPPVTIPQRTAWEIAREADRFEAVVALDVLLHHGYLRAGSMDSWTKAHPRSRAVLALALADGRAESTQETRTRLRLLVAGLPPPVPQYKVRFAGHFVARVDLAWPAVKVAVEYDGEWHAEIHQFAKDQVRRRKLLRAGWRVFHLTNRDLQDPDLFAGFIRELRAELVGAAKNAD